MLVYSPMGTPNLACQSVCTSYSISVCWMNDKEEPELEVDGRKELAFRG